jgi:hypothetical protein
VTEELRKNLCSELVPMSDKLESEVEFAQVLGVGLEVARLRTSSNPETAIAWASLRMPCVPIDRILNRLRVLFD